METLDNSYIAGIGAYLPSKRVTSEELMAEVNSTRFGIPENYISRHVGILERRVAAADQQPSDLATLASESALRDAGATADEIDLLIFTGITRDYEEPSTAHNVQHKLGASHATCLDVSNACLGVMTGLSIADAYIKSRLAEAVLICTGETVSRVVADFLPLLTTTADKKIFKDTFGFLTAGDAGGALLVRRSPSPEKGWQWLGSRSIGEHARLCYYQRSAHGHQGAMIMQEISRRVIGMHAEQIQHTYESVNWSPDSISKLYCHQVGKKPHTLLAQVAQIDIDRAPITYKWLGNLTSATIPVNMHMNRPKRGDRLLFLGSGSGLTISQGAMVF